jgi:hypothetical protein
MRVADDRKGNDRHLRCLHPCLGQGSIAWEVAAGGLDAREAPEREGRPAVAEYEAYCVKCREKRKFEGTEVTLKNGRKAAQGQCPVCGTKVMRILGKSAS